VVQLREAEEEVGLPMYSPHLHTLCLLQPFVSLKRLWVTPVVVFLSDPSVLDQLKPSPAEVERIFTHPLLAFLDVNVARHEPLVALGSEDWPYEVELYVSIHDIPSKCTSN
jgi:coenzyme A diphosphatase NUDT7